MNSGTSCNLSVVIPFYNEADSLPELYRRVTGSCRQSVGDDYEVVFVNDGSTDSGWPLLKDIAGKDPKVVGQKRRILVQDRFDRNY